MFKSNAKYFIKSTITQTQAAGTTFNLSTDFEGASNLETGTDSVSLVLKNGTQIERFEITATGGVATIVKRGITQGVPQTEDVNLQKQWSDGTIAYITILAFEAVDQQNAKPLRLTIPKVADTTARDALYPAPTGGEIVEVASLSATQRYNSSTLLWESFGVSTPTPQASPTVAGTVEVATSAESKAGTDVGGTLALLSVLPSDIAKNIQAGNFISLSSATDSGTDTYIATATPTLTTYTTGQLFVATFAETNTTTSPTLNIDSLGAVAITDKNSIPLAIGDILTNKLILIKDGSAFKLVSELQATETRLGIVELSTDAEANTGTDTLKYMSVKQITDMVLNTSITASVNVKSSADKERGTGATTATKLKEIRIGYFQSGGTIRVTYDGKSLAATFSETANFRVYKNGVAVGTANATTSTSYVSYTDSSISVVSGDLIQLYANISIQHPGAPIENSADVRNFRIAYDITKTVKDTTVITD